MSRIMSVSHDVTCSVHSFGLYLHPSKHKYNYHLSFIYLLPIQCLKSSLTLTLLMALLLMLLKMYFRSSVWRYTHNHFNQSQPLLHAAIKWLYHTFVVPLTPAQLAFIILAGVAACCYFLFLCYMIFCVFRTISTKRATLSTMSTLRKRYYMVKWTFLDKSRSNIPSFWHSL